MPSSHLVPEYREKKRNWVEQRRRRDKWEVTGGRGQGDLGISMVLRNDSAKWLNYRV